MSSQYLVQFSPGDVMMTMDSALMSRLFLAPRMGSPHMEPMMSLTLGIMSRLHVNF